MKPYQFIVYCFSICLLQSCISSRNWQENQYLLQNQSIKGNKSVSSDKLTVLFRQKPNRKILFLKPYLWFYQIGKIGFNAEKIKAKGERVNQKMIDKIREAESSGKIKSSARLIRKKERKSKHYFLKSTEGNFLMRTIGEKPTFYDSLLVEETAKQIKEFLHKKGFFQATVGVEKQRTASKRIDVIYNITEKEATYIGKVNYVSSDSAIRKIIQENISETALEEGESYDTQQIDAERSRIEKLLRNLGYYDFKRQYILFDIDSLHFKQDTLVLDSLNIKDSLSVNPSKTTEKTKRIVSIKVIINDPAKSTHKAYNFENVYFHLVNTNRRKEAQIDTLKSKETGIQYIYTTKKLQQGYKVLDRRIKIKPGQLYKDENFFATQNGLGSLDMFKFISLKPDTTKGRLNVNIFSTPNDKYQLSDEIGVNTSLSGLVPGPFISVALKNRNTFGGYELFENSIRFSIIGQTGFSTENQLYSSQEFAFNSGLTFPKLFFPRKLIPSKLRENIENYNPSTQLNLGLNYTQRPEYTRTNISASMSYKGQLRFATYNLTLAELSVVNTSNKSDAFNQQLLNLQAQGNPIINSFDRALVSSIYFIYTYNNSAAQQGKSSFYFRFLGEAGGTTLNLLREIATQQNERIFGLRYFQYWRLNPTFHFYLPIDNRFQVLAFRLNAGIAKSYGTNSALPYEKYFFAGGSTSMRAWRPRRLGPGSFSPSVNENGTFNYQFEQPGEIILEGNIEYRFGLTDLIRMALFLDAGNVWTLENDESRPGSQFKTSSFLSEIALGSGVGLRFNLPFLLLRLDLGLKMYDPARRPDRRWVVQQLFAKSKGLLVLNAGIGYPF